ncbi:MAG: glycosyltransferase [Candidatus Zixiibacteriota bacterium]
MAGEIVVSAPLRILVLADARSFHTERFVAQLRIQGCSVLLASLEPGEIECHQITRRGPMSSLHYLFAIGQVRKLIKEFAPDIVNAHFATGYGFLTSLAVGKIGPPIVLNLWGSDVLVVPQKSALHRTKLSMAINSANLVCADSGYLLDQARQYREPHQAAVIPWGIEREYLALYRPECSIGVPLRIIVPRHHESVYNNEFILRALVPLLKDGIATLTIPDWGRGIASFRKLATDLDCKGVSFYSRMKRPEFLRMMSEHDIYLSAASTDSSPVSLIEAMALGLMPIAADIPGIAEWLTPQNGLLYPPGDESRLRECIGTIREIDLSALRRESHERVRRHAIFEENIAWQIALMKKCAEKGSQQS